MEDVVGRFARNAAILIALVLMAWSDRVSIADAAQQNAQPCTAAATLVRVPQLTEASGLALSRRVPGRLWTHNDSGQPVLFALDSRGAVTGQLRVSGAKVEDWEAVAVGPCGGGSCIYIGDIGDNEAKRRSIVVYRVPEPEGASGTATGVDTLRATYPDGAHDAETLLVAGGRLYIVTKGETGPVGLYRFPAQLQSGTAMKLERVGEPSLSADADSRITDGAVSPDDQWIVLRSKSALTFYRASELLAGRWRAASTVDLTPLNEPQGEGLALGAGNTVFVAGEGGGKKQPGTFARFACAPKA
jgi:hypothetical protein